MNNTHCVSLLTPVHSSFFYLILYSLTSRYCNLRTCSIFYIDDISYLHVPFIFYLYKALPFLDVIFSRQHLSSKKSRQSLLIVFREFAFIMLLKIGMGNQEPEFGNEFTRVIRMRSQVVWFHQFLLHKTLLDVLRPCCCTDFSCIVQAFLCL